jgi:hypothetical protein
MDFVLNVLLKNINYLWMVFFIMISAGLAKQYQLFAPAYAYVKNTFRSNRFVVVLLSAIGGVLPIEGRVTVSAGLLDTVAPKSGPGREKMGIVDYLATHHYYMWSPLEKTVILPIAAFGLTYAAWIGMVWPLIAISLIFIYWYIWQKVKDDEIVITPGNFKMSAVARGVVPMFVAIAAYIAGANFIACFGFLTLYYMFITQQWDIKKLLGYVNWNVLIVVGVAIVLGNYFKSESAFFEAMIKGSAVDPTTLIGITILSVLSFVFSFLMGSSGKYVALAVLTAQAFGPQYFLWFFAVDYAGYLLSPTHKCVMVGNTYFGTPLKTYYSALGTWSALLIIVAGISTFLV